jgi:probable rRNA maturation factor
LSEAPVVVAINEQQVVDVAVNEWSELALTVLVAEGVATPAELNVTFVDVATMSELNREHMGGTGPTDVLSFPLDDDPGQVFGDHTRLLGDVVICPEVVTAEKTDMALIVVHGVLHILGMDHAEPAETELMRTHEQTHLDAWSSRS